MNSLKIQNYQLKAKKIPPHIDLSGFFAFFGVSGVDHDRQKRIDERYELEHYPTMITLTLNSKLPAGKYQLEGLPERLNWRDWVSSGGNTVSSDLSSNALEEFEEWWASSDRAVRPVPLFEG